MAVDVAELMARPRCCCRGAPRSGFRPETSRRRLVHLLGKGQGGPIRLPGSSSEVPGWLRITRRNCSRTRSAASRARRRPSVVAMTCPTRRPGGNRPPSPEVTMRSPGAHVLARVDEIENRRLAELSPIRSACCPDGWIVTGMRLLLSVSSKHPSRAFAHARHAPTTPSPSIVAQPSRMPSRAPTLIRTDRRKGEPLSARRGP
jgi:hypothetical protein